MNSSTAYNMRIKQKPQKYRYNNIDDDFDYGEKSSSNRRGRPAGRKDPDSPSNPYKKVFYKKRRSYIDDPKEGNDGNRSPGSEDDKNDDNYAGKSFQDDKSDFASEKFLRQDERRVIKSDAIISEAENISKQVDAYKRTWENCIF